MVWTLLKAQLTAQHQNCIIPWYQRRKKKEDKKIRRIVLKNYTNAHWWEKRGQYYNLFRPQPCYNGNCWHKSAGYISNRETSNTERSRAITDDIFNRWKQTRNTNKMIHKAEEKSSPEHFLSNIFEQHFLTTSLMLKDFIVTHDDLSIPIQLNNFKQHNQNIK